MPSLQTKIVSWSVPDLASADELVRSMRRLSARSRTFDGDLAAAELVLVELGFDVENVDGVLTFAVPEEPTGPARD